MLRGGSLVLPSRHQTCLNELAPPPSPPHLLQAEKDCDALRAEINRITQQVHEQESSLTEHSATIAQLRNVIAEADQVGVGGVLRWWGWGAPFVE